eukprot:4098535-Pyramimonas_sp.AAC.2
MPGLWSGDIPRSMLRWRTEWSAPSSMLRLRAKPFPWCWSGGTLMAMPRPRSMSDMTDGCQICTPTKARRHSRGRK